MIIPSKFVSFFKIDGKPIPPPVMTKEKREEMIRFREKAVLIENNLQIKRAAELEAKNEGELRLLRKFEALQRSPNQALNFQWSEAESESTIDNEYLRVSNLYRQPLSRKSVGMPLTLSSHLQKSDIFIYDIGTNTLSNSCNEEDISKLSPSISCSSIISMISNVTSTQNSNISPVPATAPTEDHDEESKSTKLSAEAPLCRSKSFTLERPSTVLLKHMDHQRTVQRRKSTATNDINEYKAKKVGKIPAKMSTSTGTMSSLRNKKSPYESKSTKMIRKKVPSSSKLIGNLSLDPLRNVEEIHRQKFLDLLKRQKEEQKALQQHFELQQQLLMDEITKINNESKVLTKSPVTDSMSPTFRKSHSDCSELKKKSPIRRLIKSFSPDISAKRVNFS